MEFKIKEGIIPSFVSVSFKYESDKKKVDKIPAGVIIEPQL